MRWAWKSDRGLVRQNNEDAVLADEAHGIFLLADGMGGGPGGEVASEIAVTIAHRRLLPGPPGDDSDEVRLFLAQALSAAHAAVAKQAAAKPSLKGMATTLEIVYLHGSTAFVCHVGDSRVYLYRSGKLRQITTDDNYAGLLAANGMPQREIPPAYRHILTQAVGLSEEIVPELPIVALESDDLLLICSDGLTEALEYEDISAVLREHRRSLSRAVDALVAAAIDRGGADNISVVLVEPGPEPAAPLLLT